MTAKGIKVYLTKVSPNSRRVEAVIHQQNLQKEVDIEWVDISSGRLQSPEFLAINPNGKVPAMTHGNYSLWESIAIMHYLANFNRDETFFPAGEKGRVEVTRWEMWESMHFNKAVGAICWETIAKPFLGLGSVDQEALEAGQGNFHQFAKVLENHLKKNSWVLGDNTTIADFSVGSHSHLALHPKSQVPLENYPAIKHWYHALEEHPAWAATAPEFD